ncbi:T9SS type A sorting domain-containing protein [Spirosoma montaniterrae]|nr:T9SS type A sorting domain-containing protein [Spirosoma montaniterrae]
MKTLLLTFFWLGCLYQAIAQPSQTPCVVTNSYSLSYLSGTGTNCSFRFQPTVTIDQRGGSVKLAEYTFTIGATVVQVCYSGTPAASVPCSGSYQDLPSGANLLFPAVTITLPCSSGSLSLRGSTATSGNSTCTGPTQLFNGPLPVELLSFYGISKPEGILLNWATQWETKNEGFDIEKSLNANSFERVGFVKGQQTTTQLSTYEFLDATVRDGETYYYRLKQKDVGGAFAYSRIIAVRHALGQEMPAKVFPNANAGGTFMLSMLDAQSATLQLYSEAGLEIPVTVTKTGDPNSVSVSAVGSIAKGIYLLKVSKAGGSQPIALKVLVQ